MSVKYLTRDQFREAYIKSLNQDIKNIKTNLEANRFFIETGTPSRPADIRTITEKTADVEGLKSLLRAELKKVTDSTNASLIIQGLDNDELQFLYTQFSGIEKEIVPRFKTGVPADIFINFLRKYIERFEKTGGVEEALSSQLETALEPVIEEISAERSERTKKKERGTGKYESKFDPSKLPVDEDWSNFDNAKEIKSIWSLMKNEIKRQKRDFKLTDDQKQRRENLLVSMNTIGKNVSVVNIKKWCNSQTGDFQYLLDILTAVEGAGFKQLNRKITGKGIAVALPKQERKKLGFKNFGKYIIDVIGLDDDIVTIRSASKASVPSIPRQKVSKRVSSVLKTIAGGGIPTYEEVGELKNDEKTYLSRVLKTARLSNKVNIPNPSKSEEEAEQDRFNILRGEITSGNDAVEVVREFKRLLIKFSNEGRLPKRQVNEVLAELLLIGL